VYVYMYVNVYMYLDRQDVAALTHSVTYIYTYTWQH
jgi:hypothetical protein